MFTNALHLILALVLILASAFHDRWIGKGQDGRTIPVLSAFLVMVSIAWLAGVQGHGPVVGPWGTVVPSPWVASIAFTLAWLFWRTWDFATHVINPRNSAEYSRTFRRHMLALAFMVPAVLMGMDMIHLVRVAICMTAFAALATVVGHMNYLHENEPGDWNHNAERIRGGLLGLALSISFLLP